MHYKICRLTPKDWPDGVSTKLSRASCIYEQEISPSLLPTRSLSYPHPFTVISMSSDLQKCIKCGVWKAQTEYGSTRHNPRRGRVARPKKTCDRCLKNLKQLYEPKTFTIQEYPLMIRDEFLQQITDQTVGAKRLVKGSVMIADAPNVVDDFVAQVSAKDGFRWFKQDANAFVRVDGAVTCEYRCSQRQRAVQSVDTNNVQRHRKQTTYFCNGRIHIMQKPSHLLVSYSHESHPPPPQLAIRDSAVREYIIEASLTRTAPEIMQMLVRGAVPNSDITGMTTSSIYNLWLKTTSSQYQRHSNAHRSAQLLVPELENLSLLFSHSSTTNKPRLALTTIFLPQLINEPIIECYVDDTKGLEHAGLKMYAVLGLVQSKAVPVSYFFCATGDEPGDTTTWLKEWFEALKNHTLHPLKPTILFSDKDAAQIAAAEQTWGSDIVRLCQWHVHDAITRKLNKQASSHEERQRRLTDADLLLLDLTSQGVEVDLDWVRSNGSTSLNQRARSQVLQLVRKHGARHPALEGRDFEEIHDECLADVYRLMRELDRPAMFRYLYINWYRRDVFKKWSLAGGPRLEGFIPIGRTTMVVESHWNDLKNRWFRRSHRPRLDYVLHRLDKDILPAIAHRLRNAATYVGNDPPSWWRAFRSVWKESLEDGESDGSTAMFQTNLLAWRCSCPSFRQSHVLLCSHLVQLSVTACPRLRKIHWTSVRRNQFPPYVTIDQIHNNIPSPIVIEDSNDEEGEEEANDDTSSVRSTTMIEHFETAVANLNDDNPGDEDLQTIGDVLRR